MHDLIPFTHNDEPVTPGEHCLYLVEFVDAGVKVGITIDPARRISQHRRDASAYGREVGRTWVSIPHGNARQNESALKQYMHHLAVKGYDFTRADGTVGTSYTTRVQPSGVEFTRRKLGLPALERNAA